MSTPNVVGMHVGWLASNLRLKLIELGLRRHTG
jgi:hypothetical protein